MTGKFPKTDFLNRNRTIGERVAIPKREKRNDEKLNSDTFLLRKFALTSPDVLFLLDPALQKVEILNSGKNQQFSPNDDLEQKLPGNFLEIIDKQERLKFLHKLKSFDQRSNSEGFEEIKLSIPCISGRQLYFNFRLTPHIIQENGEVQSWLCQARDITNSKEHLKELENRNLKLQMALDGSHMGIWSYDPLSQKLECDTRTCQIFGVKQSEFLGDINQFFIQVHPDDRHDALQTALSTLKGKGRFNHEFRIISKGSVVARPVAILGEMVSNEQAEVTKITGLCLDISQYKIAGNRINTNEAFLEESQRIANIGCYDWDLTIDKISLTRQLYKILEVGGDDTFSFQYFLDKTHPEDKAEFEIAIKKAIKEGTEFNKELRYFPSGGKAKVLWLRGHTIRNIEKRTSRIIGTIQDITSQKEKEKELNTQNLIIRSILDNLPVIILIVDKKGIVKTLLGSGLQRIGMSENETVGQNIFEQYPAIGKHVFKVLDGETVSFTEELNINEERIHFLSYYFYDPERELAIGFSIDITAQKNAEEAFLQVSEKNQELERMNQVMDMFVYAVAHDLKNPINNLEILSSLMKDALNKEEEEEYLNALRRSVSRLKQTINGLTEIIEIESSRDLHGRMLRFEDIFEHVIADLRPLLKQKSGVVETQFKESSLVYNQAFLISIFKNLLSNAIKYAAPDRPLKINVFTERRGDFVVLVVSDNGIGMDLKLYGQKLFKPFKRFTHQAEGKGVGLHLIKSMLEKNGGSIQAKSVLNKGTTFTCFLKPF